MTTIREDAGRPSPTPDGDIPNKLYFKIGEVAALVGVQTHVLRYWEKEVPAIRPTKSDSQQRRYRRKDVEIFREIRRLLYEERYTLAGARKRIMSGRAEGGADGEGGEPFVFEPGDGEELDAVTFAPRAEPAAEPAAFVAAPLASSSATGDATNAVRFERARQGLRELIRLAGESV